MPGSGSPHGAGISSRCAGRHHRPPLGMIIPASIAILVAPLYLFTSDPFWITVGFGLQGAFGGALYSQLPSYLSERFPTEVRATASAFCYHQGAIFGGFVPLVLTFLAERFGTGLAEPMIIGTWIGSLAWAAAAFFGPETKGKVLVPDLVIA